MAPVRSQKACVAPTGFVANADDCNDGSLAVNPGVNERCNSIDDDCDGAIDESDAIDAERFTRMWMGMKWERIVDGAQLFGPNGVRGEQYRLQWLQNAGIRVP